MSEDATGFYSGWAKEKVTCPVCAAAPGTPCDLTAQPRDDGAEHGVHLRRTYRYTDAENAKQALKDRQDLENWKLIALYLADCHAATLSGALGRKSTPKSELDRLFSICGRTAAMFETGRPDDAVYASRHQRVEDVIKRLRSLVNERIDPEVG